ncbi:hypothetical protein OQA88_11763 [Cercophora sp. LCS_1]
MSATSAITLPEVQKHNKPDDLWLVIHNKVYNATNYLQDHPGGDIIIREVAGTDATEVFEEVGHSMEANDVLKELFVGHLDEEHHAEAVEVFRPTFHETTKTAAVLVPKKTTKSSSKNGLAKVVVHLGLAAGAGALAYYAKHRYGLWIVTTLKRRLSAPALQFPSSSSTPSFWVGFGIATIAEVSLSMVLATWAWSKFDVQEEFTHFSSHRAARKDRTIKVLRKPALTESTLAARSGKKTKTSTVLEPQTWRPFKLVRKTLVSPNVFRLVFALPRPHDALGLPTGQHVALRATVNGKGVSRSYTPVSNDSDLGRIELLIKVYEQGAMTKHLEAMNIGDTIEMRGPKGAMQYSSSYAKEIGMIAGGTGITPMYQLIRAICEDETDKTKVSLIYANNTVDDILLKEELDGFAVQCPDKFKVHYVLSRPQAEWTGSSGFVTAGLIDEFLPRAAETTKVLLCGPPPMINAMSKNLVGLGFKAPGTLSKATDQVFLF